MNLKTADQFRIEEDLQIPAERLWGAQGQRSLIKSPIGVQPEAAQNPGLLTGEQLHARVRPQEMSHPVGGRR
jgi:hypothetical protein